MSTHLGLSDGTSSYSEPESGNRFFFPNMPVSEIYLCSLVAKRRKQRELPRAQSHSILYSGIIGPCRNLRSFYIKTVIPSEKWWCPIICGLLYACYMHSHLYYMNNHACYMHSHSYWEVRGNTSYIGMTPKKWQPMKKVWTDNAITCMQQHN